MNEDTILIVDDSYDWRKTLFGMLSDEGFVVVLAESALDALGILNSRSIDIVILDIRMDDSDAENMDGLLLAAEIQNKWPSIKVVILTAYGTVETVRVAFKKYKVTDYIQKNETEKLVDVLRQLSYKKKNKSPKKV